MSDTPELVFSFAPDQNQFFHELADALIDELAQLGVSARAVTGEFPEPVRGRVTVILPPHEYVALTGWRPPAELLERCIAVSAEQPTSHFFEQNLELASDFGAVFDINRRAVREYRQRDVEAQHLALGYTRSWDRFAHEDRDIDIAFVGRLTERRERALSYYADLFERFNCHLQLWDNSRPASPGSPGYLGGEVKRDFLSRTKVLLSIHGEDEPYFEWLRVVEAIDAGCVVVSEHSTDMAPLVSGTDLLTGEVERLDLLCAAVVEDTALRGRLRESGYARLSEELPMREAARALADAARRIDEGEPRSGASVALARLDHHQAGRAPRPSFEFQPPSSDASPAQGRALRALKSQALATLNLRRRLAVVEGQLATGELVDPTARIVHESSGWTARPWPGVSVIVPLYNHRDHVIDSLTSVVQSTDTDWEVVVVDDGSGDGGGEAVQRFMEAHDHLAMRLVLHPLNRGLAPARNTGAEFARGALLLMLDADNELRRTAITKLRAALERDSDADFAYGIIERFNQHGPVGLLSVFPWQPERLRQGNYIDALAMIRRDALLALDGYSTDARLALGWEDYDLWARMAEDGRHAAFVPQIIARYRVGLSSMVSTTNISAADAYAAVFDHAPELMAGVRIPD